MLRFTDPAGKCVPDVAEKRSRGNVFELMAQHTAEGISITPKTPVPGWLGESMDDEIVVHLLEKND